ncbi:hypothetical protein D3C74_339750 [compost metagenome]
MRERTALQQQRFLQPVSGQLRLRRHLNRLRDSSGDPVEQNFYRSLLHSERTAIDELHTRIFLLRLIQSQRNIQLGMSSREQNNRHHIDRPGSSQHTFVNPFGNGRRRQLDEAGFNGKLRLADSKRPGEIPQFFIPLFHTAAMSYKQYCSYPLRFFMVMGICVRVFTVEYALRLRVIR